jgi:putative spermidine/putrescine transport system permease protein
MPGGKSRLLLANYAALICVYLLVPALIVFALAFSGDGYLKFPPSSLSLRWFARFFGDSQWLDSLWSSVMIGCIACPIATVLGFFAAYALVRSPLWAKKQLLSLLLLPMIVPTIITAVGMYFLAASLGFIGSIVWLGCCHAVVALPIVLLILLSTLQSVDANLERAALSLGSSRLRVFTRVVVPLALPGLLSAMLFAFLTSFDELLISLFLADIRTQTLPVRIWNSLLLEVSPTIAAVSAFLGVVSGVVLLVDRLLRRRATRTRSSVALAE